MKWVWTYKFYSSWLLTKFKSRLCVRGDLQLPTLQDKYATTLAVKTFRAMLALTCAFELETRQYDLVNAFCNTELSPHVFCKLPLELQHPDSALRVKKNTIWSSRITETLVSNIKEYCINWDLRMFLVLVA